MSMKPLIASALVTVALALPTPAGIAYAKNGGHGGGGHEGSGGHNGGNSSGRDKSDGNHSKAAAKSSDDIGNRKSRSNEKRLARIAGGDAAERAGLNSLKRNYHAYLNSRDPRFADVFAYVRGYAEYELANGVGAVPPGREYSDEALREALATAAGTPTVSDASLNWAKSILGVGDDIGKIDQARDAMADSALGN